MDNSPPVHVEILSNARDFHITEQNNYIAKGNQYIFTSDQASK
jgi:hypothetical protein